MDVHLRFRAVRQGPLGILGLLQEVLPGSRVLLQIDLGLGFELPGDIVGNPLVPVDSPQANIAVGGNGAMLQTVDLHQRSIERASAQVIDQDLLPAAGTAAGIQEAVLEPIGQGGGGRLVDDVQNFQTGQPSGIHGCLAARFVEVSGNGNHDLLEFA